MQPHPPRSDPVVRWADVVAWTLAALLASELLLAGVVAGLGALARRAGATQEELRAPFAWVWSYVSRDELVVGTNVQLWAVALVGVTFAGLVAHRGHWRRAVALLALSVATALATRATAPLVAAVLGS